MSDNETIAGRLKSLRIAHKMTQKKLSDVLNCSQAKVSDYESGKLSVSNSDLSIIANTYNVNLNWLLTGDGDMYMGIAREGDHISGIGKMVRIPVVSAIAAGPCIQATEGEPLEIIQVPISLLKLPPPYYAFRVEGDSMSPFIIEGDIVVLSRDWRGVHLDDKICGFRTCDGITLKRLLLQPKKKTAWLMPMNHDYHPIQYDRDTPDLELVGVLVLSIRRHV